MGTYRPLNHDVFTYRDVTFVIQCPKDLSWMSNCQMRKTCFNSLRTVKTRRHIQSILGEKMSKCAQKSGRGNFQKSKIARTPKLLGQVFFLISAWMENAPHFVNFFSIFENGNFEKKVALVIWGYADLIHSIQEIWDLRKLKSSRRVQSRKEA